MRTDGKTRVCGIIANPVAHSMSPLLQNLYAKRTGINLTYVPFKVEEEGLKAAVRGAFALDILGMNVTVPHKQAVIPWLSEIDETASAIGAVNTLVRTEKGYKGYNTDVPGLLRAVTEAGIIVKGRKCILIGAGGAAKAAAYMLAKEGASLVYILNRNEKRAEQLASYINKLSGRTLCRALPLSEYKRIPKGQYLAVQTTSVGMHPNVNEAPIEDKAFYENISEAIDAIYTPFETKFMKLVTAAGGRAVNGLNMLLYQGVIAYELWNPDVKVSEETIEEARQLILERLMKKSGKQPEKPQQVVKNLILIGFMGAGKTTVGLHYADKNGIPVVDTDKLIEMTSRMSVSDIFTNFGEDEFRKKETQMLKNLLNADMETKHKTLISVGGGLPLLPENRQLMKELGTVIYLKISPDTVLERLKGDTTRPLLQGDNVRQRVEELMTKRDSLYMEAAHGVVVADGKSYDEIVQEIESLENQWT